MAQRPSPFTLDSSSRYNFLPPGNVCQCSGFGNNPAQNCRQTAGPGIDQTIDYWTQNDCLQSYATYLYQGSDGQRQFNPDHSEDLNDYINNLFELYVDSYQITANTQNPSFNSFQTQLLNLCNNPQTPGVCQQALGNFCSSLTSDQILADQALINFCGCYVDLNTNSNNLIDNTFSSNTCDQQNTNRACSPACHRVNTVQIYDLTSGQACTCPNDICVINDTAINIQNSLIGGDINITNICSSCLSYDQNDDSNCTCIISGTDLNQTFAEIGVGTNINQFCGPDSQCYQTNSQGNLEPVDCSQFNGNNYDIAIPVDSTSIYLTIVIFIIVVIIIILISLYLR